jgi:hypothetical protein
MLQMVYLTALPEFVEGLVSARQVPVTSWRISRPPDPLKLSDQGERAAASAQFPS